MNDHQKRVYEFLKEAEERDPQKYKDVCDKHRVLTWRQWKTVHEREKPRGLLLNEEE